jgi:hypothetical protein
MPTIITGTIKNLGGVAITSGCMVSFELKGLNGNVPRVNGTAIIAPGIGSGSSGSQRSGRAYIFEYTPDANGSVAGGAQLYSTRDAAGTGNGDIEAGGSFTSVWYEMVVSLNGKRLYTQHVHAKNGATLDISTVTPISTNPVTTAPTGDTTYARLDGGNTPFTGIVQFLQGILLALGKSVAWSTDLFLGRGAAGKLTVGTTAGASDGTVSAATYQVGGVSQSGTGPLAGTVSPVLTTPNIGVATATTVQGLTGQVTPNAAGGIDVGTAALPFSGVRIGAAATNNARLTGTFTAARVYTLADLASDTFVMLAAAQTLLAKTFTAPIINGTPTGTGIPTVTLKKGTGGGAYSSASTAYVQVDGTNLAATITIPTGWKLIINAAFRIGTLTAVVACNGAIADGGSVVVETSTLTTGIGIAMPASLSWVINGDGAAHTVDLRYKTSNAADSVTIGNSSATDLPTMVFLLTPSN